MKAKVLLGFAEKLGEAFLKHKSTILVITGMGLCATSTVTAVMKAPKYVRLKAELDSLPKEERHFKDYLDVASPFILPAVSLTVGLICIGTGYKTKADDYAKVLAAYTMQSEQLKDLQDATKDLLGPKKQEELEAKKMEHSMEHHPYDPDEEAYVENAEDKGNDLCYDCLSGRYFRSSINDVKSAVNNFNKTLLYQNWGSLNDLYDEIGIPEIKLGDELGWCVDKDMPEVEVTPVVGPHDEACLCIDYSTPPVINYRNYF